MAKLDQSMSLSYEGLSDKIASKLSTFDVDGDGRVDAGELAEVVEKLLREEAESGRIKYDAFSDRIRGKLNKFDENEDGTIDAEDLEGVINGLVEEEANSKKFRLVAVFATILMLFILCANAGLAVTVALLSKDAVVDNDVMVSKATGHVLQVASSDFFLDDNGKLVSRVTALNQTVIETSDGRRLLQEVDAAPAAVVTAPMTDADGVLSTDTGSPVQMEQASYTTVPDDDFDVEELFDLPMSKLKAIEDWEVADPDDEGGSIDLTIVGVEVEEQTTRNLEEQLGESTPAGESGNADDDRVLVVKLIKLLSSHYKYSMLAIYKFEIMSADLQTTLEVKHIGPTLIEKGQEDQANIDWMVTFLRDLGKEAEDELGSDVPTRHLMARTLLGCRWWDAFCWLMEGIRRAIDLAIKIIKAVITLAIKAAQKILKKIVMKVVEGIAEMANLNELFSGVVTKVLDFIKEAVPWLPDAKMLTGAFEDMIDGLMPAPGLCLPMGILTAKVTDANAKSFLNKQSVTIFDQPKIGAVTTQLTDLQHCAKLGMKLNFEDLEKFLPELLTGIIVPALMNVLENMDQILLGLIDGFIEEAVEKVVKGLEEAEKFADQATSEVKGADRGRRLMGYEELTAATEEEAKAAIDDLIAHAVGVAAERKGIVLKGVSGSSAARRELMTGVVYDEDSLLGRLHILVQNIFDVTHGAVMTGLHAEMDGRREEMAIATGMPGTQGRHLLQNGIDWRKLLPLDSFTLDLTVGFEETFNVIFRKNSTSVISGDLLDKAGVTQDIKMPYKFAGEDFPTPIPGFTVGFEMTIDLSMPFTMMSEGIAEVAVIVSAKNIKVLIDAVKGTIDVVQGSTDASGVVLSGHTRVSGAVDVKFGMMAKVKACVFGPCVALSASGRAAMHTGFDAVYGFSDNQEVSSSYLDSNHEAYIGKSLLNPKMEYHVDQFSCIEQGFSEGKPSFAAGGVYINIPQPFFGLKFQGPQLPLPGDIGKPIVDAGAGSLGGWLYEYRKDADEEPIYAEPLKHYCSNDPPTAPTSIALRRSFIPEDDLNGIVGKRLAEQGIKIEELN